MRRTKLIATVIWILVISGFAVSNVYGETTIAVDDSGGADYTSIQEAVYNANDGDTILVHAGTYTENVNVAKQLTIKSESENPDGTIVQASDPNDHVFYATADNVTISGFRVTGANGIGKDGIHLEGVTACDVANNIVSNNWCGIYLLDSRKNTLRDNTVKSNSNYGIFLVKSGNNTLHNNLVNSNNRYGIALDTSNNNNLSDNTVHSNGEHGIALGTSSHNRMRNNNIFNNTYNFGSGNINDIDTSNTVDGKRIYYLVGVSDATIDSSSNAGTVCCINCRNISIKDLTLKNNRCGICLHNTIDSYLDNNTASKNRCGIGIYDSDHNKLSNNTANANEWRGISLQGSWYNTLHNNTVSQNKYGIDVHTSQYNEIVNNNASNNLINSVGIEQALSDNNNLFGNFLSKNRYGIVLYKCNNNEIAGNTLLSNSDCGIYLRYSDDNDLSSNTVRSNRLGIHLLDYSRNNTVNGNFLSNNSEDIKTAGNSDNQIYNNEISDGDTLQTPSYNHFFGSSPLNREVIDRHGKLPPLETEEQKQNWSDSLEELGKSAKHGRNGRTGLFPTYMYPDGMVLACGENSLGYFVVVFYRNLTIEKQLIYEIYTIIDENARDMGIQEIPVEFESAVFRYDGGYIDLLATLKEKQKIPLEEYMNRESASYRPDAIATYGKLPEIETEEQCWRWFHKDTLAIIHGSRDRMDPYFTDGILVSCGSYIDGYIEVTVYENLTIETQPIMEEIYEIIDYEAKKIGIHEVPVVFFEGEFVRIDPGLMVEDSDDARSPADDIDEPVPGFGLLGGLIAFLCGWLFRRKQT